jgi:hypothetical protein
MNLVLKSYTCDSKYLNIKRKRFCGISHFSKSKKKTKESAARNGKNSWYATRGRQVRKMHGNRFA